MVNLISGLDIPLGVNPLEISSSNLKQNSVRVMSISWAVGSCLWKSLLSQTAKVGSSGLTIGFRGNPAMTFAWPTLLKVMHRQNYMIVYLVHGPHEWYHKHLCISENYGCHMWWHVSSWLLSYFYSEQIGAAKNKDSILWRTVIALAIGDKSSSKGQLQLLW